MLRALLVLTLLTLPALARADRTVGEQTGRAVDDMADSAEDMAETAEEATRGMGGKLRSLSTSAGDLIVDGLDSALDASKSLWGKLGDRASKRAEDGASDLFERGKSAASDLLTSLREETRALLLEAAEALDTSATEARQATRRARWEKLKARFSLRAAPSEALSEELRDHEYRVARLKRAHALAREADDEPARERAEQLLEREDERHKLRMDTLRRERREEAAR